MKGQDVTGKVMAGDGHGLGAPRGGSYGSSSWVFSTSVLLACCPLLGFMSSRGKGKGRRAFQQKCPINQDLLPPAEVRHGGHLPLWKMEKYFAPWSWGRRGVPRKGISAV